MAQKSFSTKQIIRLLRGAEVELAKGKSVDIACTKIGVTPNTHYRAACHDVRDVSFEFSTLRQR